MGSIMITTVSLLKLSPTNTDVKTYRMNATITFITSRNRIECRNVLYRSKSSIVIKISRLNHASMLWPRKLVLVLRRFHLVSTRMIPKFFKPTLTPSTLLQTAVAGFHLTFAIRIFRSSLLARSVSWKAPSSNSS